METVSRRAHWLPKGSVTKEVSLRRRKLPAGGGVTRDQGRVTIVEIISCRCSIASQMQGAGRESSLKQKHTHDECKAEDSLESDRRLPMKARDLMIQGSPEEEEGCLRRIKREGQCVAVLGHTRFKLWRQLT